MKQDIFNKIAYTNSQIFSLFSTLMACYVHPKTLGKYKGINKGKEVVLVGGGPTVEYFHPIKGVKYATVNNCCKYDKVKFDYLFLQELHEDGSKNKIANEYNYINCKKFYGIIPQYRLSKIYPTVKLIPQKDFEQNGVEKYFLDDKFSYKFAYDLTVEPIGDFGGTIFSAMQFLLWTRPRRIYLVGADCTASKNIFCENQQSFNLAVHINAWKKLKQFANDIYPDVEIVSINPVGLKGIFKDVYTESYKEYLDK
ncbi:hypothetical protein J6I39_02750 [bacterium]|nr:hypothetical protein [bacterium]